MALGDGQEVQIVVAEDDHCAISEVAYEAQGRERGWTSVN
jgi:hypothetical protein